MIKETKIISDLNTLSKAFKSQFEKEISLPLAWSLDEYGNLWLDNLNICRGASVNPGSCSFDKKRIVLSTMTGSIEIIIEWPAQEIALITEIIIHKKIFHF